MITSQNAKRTPTRSQSSLRSNYFPEAGARGRPLRRPGMSAFVAQRIGYRALALG
jgi:hypothetical protein